MSKANTLNSIKISDLLRPQSLFLSASYFWLISFAIRSFLLTCFFFRFFSDAGVTKTERRRIAFHCFVNPCVYRLILRSGCDFHIKWMDWTRKYVIAKPFAVASWLVVSCVFLCASDFHKSRLIIIR